jgi:hypothetical protein
VAAVATLRLIAVAGPVIDAHVHLDLAPIWFPEKLSAAFGEAGASFASLPGLLLLFIGTGLRSRTAPGAAGHRAVRFPPGR